MTSNLAVYLLRIYQTKIYVHIHMDAYSSLIYSIPKSEGLPQWLSGKESACNAGDTGLIPGTWEDSLEGGRGNPLSALLMGNPLDGVAWQVMVRTESDIQKINGIVLRNG